MDESNDTQTDPSLTPEEISPALSSEQFAMALQLLDSVEREVQSIRQILSGQVNPTAASGIRSKAASHGSMSEHEGARIIEGVFDGQNMVGPDGKQYSVPANYASKSKLVEGDVLKLTITKDGSFIYKQIGPVERQRLIGTLTKDELTNEYTVVAGGRGYKVLLASITYFKGDIGDDVVILVPKEGDVRWAAVENIIKKPVAADPANPEL